MAQDQASDSNHTRASGSDPVRTCTADPSTAVMSCANSHPSCRLRGMAARTNGMLPLVSNACQLEPSPVRIAAARFFEIRCL